MRNVPSVWRIVAQGFGAPFAFVEGTAMKGAFVILLSGLLLGGCFDNSNHPGKDSDPSKPSLQMQHPAESPAAQLAPDKDSDN